MLAREVLLVQLVLARSLRRGNAGCGLGTLLGVGGLNIPQLVGIHDSISTGCLFITPADVVKRPAQGILGDDRLRRITVAHALVLSVVLTFHLVELLLALLGGALRHDAAIHRRRYLCKC